MVLLRRPFLIHIQKSISGNLFPSMKYIVSRCETNCFMPGNKWFHAEEQMVSLPEINGRQISASAYVCISELITLFSINQN